MIPRTIGFIDNFRHRIEDEDDMDRLDRVCHILHNTPYVTGMGDVVDLSEGFFIPFYIQEEDWDDRIVNDNMIGFPEKCKISYTKDPQLYSCSVYVKTRQHNDYMTLAFRYFFISILMLALYVLYYADILHVTIEAIISKYHYL